MPNNQNVKVLFKSFYLVEPNLPPGSCPKDYVEVNGERCAGGELGGRGAGGRARAPRVESLPAIAAPPGTAERGPSLSFPARAAGSPFASIRISPTPTRASWLSTSPMTPVTVSDWLYKGAPAERGWPGTDFLFCVLLACAFLILRVQGGITLVAFC